MEGPASAPVRTEADLRAALVDLGQRAPSADAVLSEMRATGTPRRRRLPETPGPPKPAGHPARPRGPRPARAPPLVR